MLNAAFKTANAAALAACLCLGACSSSEPAGETITSAPATTAAPTTVTTTSETTTSESITTTTETTTTSTSEAPKTTLLDVANPQLVNDALPLDAPDISFIWDGLGGVFGPNGTDDWSTSAEPDDGFLGPWLHVATGPDGAIWRSRLVRQEQDCAQLQMDISTLTSPNALDFAVSLPYTSQPNCAQETLWPAGYSDSFLVTEGGLVLLHLDQEPRDCTPPECIAEVVSSIEFRPFDALDVAGIKFEAARTSMDADGRDPALARRILNDFARIGAASTDQGTFVLDRANQILTLGSADGVAVEAGSIPAFDGAGYYYSTESQDSPGTSVVFEGNGDSPTTLFTTDEYFVELLADQKDWLILNLILFEDAGLAYYNKSTGILYDTGLGGLPGVRNAYVRAGS